MEIFVCVKQVPHENCEIKPTDGGRCVDGDEFVWVINPEDECAVEQALLIKEAIPGTTVKAISVDITDRQQQALIAALAMGVDEAIQVETNEELDPYRIAKAMAGAISQCTDKPDLILTGNTSYDGQNQQVPQILAHRLGLPALTRISEFSMPNGTMIVGRQKEAGMTEVYEIDQPVVLTCLYGLNEPRYAPLPHIRRAEKTPLIKLTLEDVGVKETDQRHSYLNMRLHAERLNIEVFDATDESTKAEVIGELIKRLRRDINQLQGSLDT